MKDPNFGQSVNIGKIIEESKLALGFYAKEHEFKI